MLRYSLLCCLLTTLGYADSWSATGASAPMFNSTSVGAEFEVFLSSDSLNGQVLATWTNFTGLNPMYSIYNGSGWSSPSSISNSSTVHVDVISCFNPATGQFFASWADSTANEPYYSIYTSGSWSSAQAIAPSSVTNGYQVFNLYDSFRGYFWAAWTDSSVGHPLYGYYDTFWHIGLISNSAMSGDAVFLAAGSSGTLLAVWVDSGTTNPMYSIYDGTWSDAAQISSSSTVVQNVEACYDSVTGQFIASWGDASNNNYPTYSFYNGSTWSVVETIPPVSPSSAAAGTISLSFAPSANLLLATWTDTMSSYPTYSIYNGSSWSTPASISTLGLIVMGPNPYCCYDSGSNQFFAAWPASFNPTYSIYTILEPSPPASLSGAQKINNFGVVKERYNALSWEKNVNVTNYYLSRNGALIAVLDGTADSYEDHDQPAQNQVYSLSAVNSYGTSSSVEVTVGGSP